MIGEEETGPTAGEPALRPFSADGRRLSLDDLSRQTVDVLVVGGGITGAGVALEATRRGYTVGLVDARDFAAGTSSRSSKLVHGGFRYLAQGEVGLVREALQERGVLRAMFPDLVAPLSFLLPIPRDVRESLMLKAGLVIYDLLARGSGFPRHRRISIAEARRLAPALQRSDIRGAWVLWDAQTDDSRLTLAALQRAAAAGAKVANYAEVSLASREAAGWRVTVRDHVDDRQITVKATSLVNAAGVWADAVEGLTGRPPRARLRPSKGVHLSLAPSSLPIETALVFPAGGGRVLFAVPWKGHIVVGTTDTDFEGDIARPDCTPDEEADLLRAVNRFFGLSLGPDAVLSRWAGVRPLVAGSGARPSGTKDLSRKPWIDLDDRGLVTVTGGKLTTFRRMAVSAVDLLPTPSAGRAPAAAHDVAMENVATRAAATEALTRREPALGQALPGAAGYTLADVALACEQEMALELEDALSRRLRLSFVDVAAAWAAAPAAARVMAERLAWPSIEAHLQRFGEHLAKEFGATLGVPVEA